MLRATKVYTFPTSQLPNVLRLRLWCVLHILTWTCASRHNGVYVFDISISKSGLRPSVFCANGVPLFISHLPRPFPSQHVQNTPDSEHFLKFRCRKSARGCGAEAHFQVKLLKAPHVRTTFGRSDVVAFPKTMAGVGHLKRIRTDAFRVAGAIQETCSSEMLGGQGGDFLRRVAFWSMRSSGLLR